MAVIFLSFTTAMAFLSSHCKFNMCSSKMNDLNIIIILNHVWSVSFTHKVFMMPILTKLSWEALNSIHIYKDQTYQK